MYKIFYNMKEDPFDNTIDPKIFFPSPSHNQVLSFILSELRSNETYILIVGEYGIGKTLVCNYLVDHLKKDENFSLVVIPNPGYSYRSILKLMLEKIDPLFEFKSIEDGQDKILDYITNKSGSKDIIVILDDAQDVDLINTLPKLMSLGRVAVSDKPCLKFVIFGHLNFLKLLTYPNMETYNQRIRRRYVIAPLDLRQTKEYIYYRLVKAEAPGIPRFDEKAIVLIHEYSRGIPRLINNICDMALRIGADTKSLVIDSNIINEAISVLSQIQNTLVDKKGQEPISSDIYKDPNVTTHDETVAEPSKPSESDRKLVQIENDTPASSSFADLEKMKSKSNMVFFFIVITLVIILIAVFYYNFIKR